MRVNPVMQDMVCFTLKNDQGVTLYENDYHYEIGEPLHQLNQYPKGSYFQVVNESGNFGIHHLQEPVMGWRVPLGDHYLYLLIGEKAILEESRHKEVMQLHRELMGRNWYYPGSEDIIKYWQSPEDDYNNPEDYVKPEERSALLAGLIQKTGVEAKSALELGCNVGRNLNYLKKNLNMEVAGLEINAQAVELLRKHYPDLADASITVGDMTQTIFQVEDRSYDLVFSMAVLMHLHPKTEPVFWDKVSRIARKAIITIENENWGSERNWPRNYGEIFVSRGWREVIHFFPVKGMPGLDGYTIRAFLPAQ